MTTTTATPPASGPEDVAIVPVEELAELSAALLEAALSPRTTIDVWRRALPPVRTMDEVARDYMTLYAA